MIFFLKMASHICINIPNIPYINNSFILLISSTCHCKSDQQTSCVTSLVNIKAPGTREAKSQWKHFHAGLSRFNVRHIITLKRFPMPWYKSFTDKKHQCNLLHLLKGLPNTFNKVTNLKKSAINKYIFFRCHFYRNTPPCILSTIVIWHLEEYITHLRIISDYRTNPLLEI